MLWDCYIFLHSIHIFPERVGIRRLNLTTNRLHVFALKSSITFITPYNSELHTHPRITLNNTLQPIKNTHKILGVTFNGTMTLKPHWTDINIEVKQHLNVLKTHTANIALHRLGRCHMCTSIAQHKIYTRGPLASSNHLNNESGIL